jgi:putative flavoprotein involved in K+ transport
MAADSGAAPPNPATTQVSAWLEKFSAALEKPDPSAAAALFEDDSYWRDLVSFTWNIKTLEGRDAIRQMLASQLEHVKPRHWRIDGEATSADGFTEAWITFETAVARGHAHIRLKGERCWTLLTTIKELIGHEERNGERRIKGTEHGAVKDRQTWLDRRREEEAELGITRQPYVLIVGGGQGGIGLAARLTKLGVSTLVLEKNARAGDSWRKRYKSLCLHDPVWYDHMPYLPFPADWPVFTPKDKMGDWLESYVKVMELNYWSNTTCQKARFDEASGTWDVTVKRGRQKIVLRPTQLVIATGVSGFPNVPKIPGAETFEGAQHHSSAHPGGDGWAGKHCVVLGSNNSAHDICADLWEHGADVTMIQRSSTHVARSDTLMELGLGTLYSEAALKNGITTERADLIFASIPYKLFASFQVPLYQQIKERDADFYERLRKAGFMLDFGEDESGLLMKYLRRGSGYYIDVGASELVADGRIKLRSGVTISQIRPKSVVLSDGSELPADLIVYATGYGSMSNWAAKLISKKVANKVGKCWGLGSNTTKDPGPWEGELRNLWKPTAQPNLWFHGGNLHQSRHYSQFLSLQIKARQQGIATPVYGMTKVHHKE